jgi:uncharacterized repeat protein (TIGR03837 family)
MRFDVFCSVVDNYGDVGVCWRFIKRLAQTQPPSISDFTTISPNRLRLFCDRIDLVEKIAGSESLQTFRALGVELHPWQGAILDLQGTPFPDVVIETFSCDLPEAYLKQLRFHPNTLLINLEYLSAETWVSGAHGLASIPSQKSAPLRYFYYPGFTQKSGGLLQGPTPELQKVDESYPVSLKTIWPALRSKMLAKRISLFSYGGGNTYQLLEQLQTSEDDLDVLVCGELAQQAVAEWLGGAFQIPVLKNHLHLIPMPFIPQDDYDWLLHVCDLNIVRGEDSFLRAQWAGKPFIWEIYPQIGNTHVGKLDAFLDIFLKEATLPVATMYREAMHWENVSSWWPNLDSMAQHALKWRQSLMDQQKNGDLAIRLREFIRSKRKNS